MEKERKVQVSVGGWIDPPLELSASDRAFQTTPGRQERNKGGVCGVWDIGAAREYGLDDHETSDCGMVYHNAITRLKTCE